MTTRKPCVMCGKILQNITSNVCITCKRKILMKLGLSLNSCVMVKIDNKVKITRKNRGELVVEL